MIDDTYYWDYVDVDAVAGDKIKFEAEVVTRQGIRRTRERRILHGLVVRVVDNKSVEVVDNGMDSERNVIRVVPTTHVTAVRRER